MKKAIFTSAAILLTSLVLYGSGSNSNTSSGGGGGGGITSINSDTSAAQSIAAGTSGSDVAVATSGGTHTVNVPDAGAAARGAVTTGAQTFAGAKTFSSALSVPLGTIGAPGLYPGTDTDTGLYSPGANQIALAAGGANKFISDSSGGVRIVSSGNNSLGHSATMSLSGGGAGAAGLAIARGTYDTSMPGGVYYTATSPNGGTQNIGFRAGMDGGTISSYGFGVYVENNVTNSSTSSFAPYNASGGNVGARFDVTVAHDTGQAMGVAATGGQGKLNAGGVFQGIQPRDVSGNRVEGVRAHAARSSAAMTFPSQLVGVYGWITDTNNAGVEQRDPGVSAAGIFDNGDTTNHIFVAMDNGSSVFHIKDGGATVIGANGATPIHSINSATVATAGNTATLTNFPTSGNPSLFLKVQINNVYYYIPAWTAP